MLALLQTTGKTPRKHSGAVSLFDAELAKTGRVARELSAVLHLLFELRQEDDYQRLDPMPPEEAVRALESAEAFVRRVSQYLMGEGFLAKR